MNSRTLRFLAALSLASGVSAAHADLAGHWKLDEGSGNVYFDSSPNANHAMPASSVSLWSMDVPPTGIANTAAINFDGIGAYVDTPYVGISGNTPRTVAFWIKTTTSGPHGIVAWGLSTMNGQKWHVRLNDNATNGIVGAIRTESQGDFTIGSTPVNDGNWHHIASVYPEGGGELATVRHYVDGVLEVGGSNNAATPAVNTITTADPVTIGRRNQAGTISYFPGLIDDARIYDRALSEQEVNDLMGATPSTDGLVLYMPFEEGTGAAIDDLGSGDNDGTLIGLGGSEPVWSTDAPPHLPYSLMFGDANDILYTDFRGIGGTASRSVTFWFKTTFVADNGIVAWGDSAANGLKWHARLNSGAADGPVGALRLEIQGGRTVGTTPVNDDQWHHAAIVFEEDGDPDIGDVVFYLDGEVDPVSMFASVPINTQITDPARPVTIGGRFQGTALRGFVGNLADVRIYDSGLTQEEVQAIMTGAGEARLQLDVSADAGMLSISWESQEGLLYNLRSETDPAAAAPLDWPIYDGNQEMAATPPRNTVSFPLPADAARFFVVEEFPPPPVQVFFDDFEGGQGGWTFGSDNQPGTEWEIGAPSVVGPSEAYSGANCFGTDLDAPYTHDADIWLRSPPIDLTGATATGATLNYYRFVDIEEIFDAGTVSVLDAIDNSLLGVIEMGIEGLSADWERISDAIPAAALGKSVILEFRLFSDFGGLMVYAGFYIDDVEVTVP